MKTSEMKRRLREAGCCLKREGTNHEIWFSPITGKKFQVPRHGSQELPPGTAHSIMKQAGLK